MVPLWRHCGSSSSPERAKQGKKKIFSPLFLTDLLTSLSPINQNDVDQGPSTCTAFHVLELGEEWCP
jgi:hypothetical protein